MLRFIEPWSERPDQSRDESIHTESKAHALRNPTGQQQHEGVDDKREQAQGNDFERQG